MKIWRYYHCDRGHAAVHVCVPCADILRRAGRQVFFFFLSVVFYDKFF